jgi:serine/threonine-protein phosphatase with EF-hand domain
MASENKNTLKSSKKKPNPQTDDDLAFKILNKLEFSEEQDTLKLPELFDSLFITLLPEKQAKEIEIVVEPNYSGLRLGDVFEETDFDQMFHEFTTSTRKIHALYAAKVFDKATELLKPLPNIPELKLADKNDTCVVVGDLHGHFNDLVSIVNKFGPPGKNSYFVFNGDWVDRGEHQIEVLLTIFYAFILFPGRVFLNRGNHEDRRQNSAHKYQPCLKAATLRYFGKYGAAVYSKLDKLFRHVPLATVINNEPAGKRYFVVHGGINDKIDLERIQKLDRSLFITVCRSNNLFEKDSLEMACQEDVADLLWSDPCDTDEEITGVEFNKNRNIGKIFGPDTTDRFLKKNRFDYLIRSHQCQPKGHHVSHDGKCITVFSASRYSMNNSASVLKLAGSTSKIDILIFKPDKLDVENAAYLSLAIKKLREKLFMSEKQIQKEMKAADPEKTGSIRISKLTEILNKYVPDMPYMLIKDRLCECDDTTGLAKYSTLFESIKLSSKYSMPEAVTANFDLLVSVFHMIDSDGNGFIAREEFEKACTVILNHLGVEFTRDEIRALVEFTDKNDDGKIDLNEFGQAFQVACMK